MWRQIFWHQGYKTFSMLNSAQLVNIHNHNFHTSISFHRRLDLSLPLAHMSEKYVFFSQCGTFFYVCGMFFMFVVCFFMFVVCFSCLWYVFSCLWYVFFMFVVCFSCSFFHIATLFFCRSLQCSRITIHKNLVISYIFRFILNIIIVEPFISRRKPSYRDLVSELAHKHVHVLSYYFKSITLRRHAFSNILKISQPKNENFQIKNSDIFHVSVQKIDCGNLLEPPHRGGSNEYPQSMFEQK